MRILKFVIGGLFIIASLGMFTQKEVLTGLITAVLGIILLPPVSENLKQKFNLWNNKGLRYVFYIVLLSLVGITSKKVKFPEPNPQVSSDKVVKSETQKNDESINKEESVSSNIEYDILREWNPDNEGDAIGLDILLSPKDVNEETIKEIVQQIVGDKKKAMIKVYQSKKAYSEETTGNYSDEYKKGYVAFYVKNLTGDGAYQDFDEIRWMQEIGKLSSLYGTVTKF